MVQTYGLQTASDLLAKLERDFENLREEMSSDGFFNFVVTAYSLIDWVKNDPLVSPVAKDNIEEFRRRDPLKVCRDLANASKHCELNQQGSTRAVVESAESKQGFGVGRYGKGGFGIGEEEIRVANVDGTILDGMELAEETLAEWKAFFNAYRLNGTPEN